MKLPYAFTAFVMIGGLVVPATFPDAPRKPDAPKLEIAPAADAQPDLSGIYSVVGKEKEPYSGSVTLMQLAPGVYKVSWSLTTGDFQGAGLLSKGVLAVSWRFPGEGGRILQGVHVMVPHGKDGLSGTWTSLPGVGHPFPETWSLLGKVPQPLVES